jgi:hypothetical protein
MFLRIDAWNLSTCTIFVREGGMTADAESAAAINIQPHRILGVIIIGAMAVFAADGAVGRVLDVIILVFMALRTDFSGLIFYRVLFPLGLVGFAVPAIHITPLMGAKVLRH